MNLTLDGRTTVLIVDDEPDVQLLQRRHLERAGFLVCCASGPADALALLAQQHVDLIVLDHRLSESETGLDLIQRLCAEGHDLPVIVVTGYTHESTIIEALRSGVRDSSPRRPAISIISRRPSTACCSECASSRPWLAPSRDWPTSWAAPWTPC